MPKKDNGSIRKPSALDRVKRHPMVALVIAISALTAGAATFTASLSKIREFFLRQDAPPSVQEMQLDLSGQAIALVLEGRLDASIGEAVDAKPIVWRNPLFEEALRLQRTFLYNAPPNEDGVLLFNSGTTENESDVEVGMKLVPQFEAHFIPPRLNRYGSWAAPPSDPDATLSWKDEYQSEEDGESIINDERWNVAFLADQPLGEIASSIRNNDVSADSLIFSRKASCQDVLARLDGYGLARATLLTRYLKEGCTDTDFDEIAKYVEDACAGQSYWSSQILVPRITLSVAAIKNISKEPVSIELEYGSGRVVGVSPASTATLSHRKAKVGDGVLPAGHALIVPLGLSFSSDDVPGFSSEHDIDVYPREAISSSMLRTLMASDSIELHTTSFDDQTEPSSYFISSSRLLKNYGFSPMSRDRRPRSIGPIVKLTSLRVNGVSRTAHSKVGSEMYITAETTGGSCPYLYATDSKGESTHLGTILVGRDNVSKRGLDYRMVSQWPSTATIVERDAELTTLHGVWAVCQQPDLTLTRVSGLQNGTSKWPITLRRYESATFEFPPQHGGASCSAYFLVTDGFYERPGDAEGISSISRVPNLGVAQQETICLRPPTLARKTVL